MDAAEHRDRLERIEQKLDEALPLLRQIASFLPGLQPVADDKKFWEDVDQRVRRQLERQTA